MAPTSDAKDYFLPNHNPACGGAARLSAGRAGTRADTAAGGGRRSGKQSRAQAGGGRHGLSEAGFRLSKAPLLPQVRFSENLTRGDDPVYAFGTKLRQQVFQASDFGLPSLNRPSPLSDFDTSFSGRWTAFDSLHTRYQIKRASLMKRGAAATAERTTPGNNLPRSWSL